MPYGQLENPKGAFGYAGAETTGTHTGIPGSPGAGLEVLTARNMSTVVPILVGSPVLLSTVSTGGVGIFTGTAAPAAIGSPLFYGVALTSAGRNSSGTTVTTNNPGLGEDYAQVAIAGVVPALVSSAAVAGDILWYTTSTGTTATGSTNGGVLGVVTATAAGNYAVAGIALSSGTTGTTGYLRTTGPRALAWLNRSIVAAISTA